MNSLKKIDYQKMYTKWYKNIPNLYFWSTLIILALGAIVTGIIFMSDGDADWIMIGIGIVVGGSAVAVGLAYLNRFIAAIVISQKVVVADALLSMQGDVPAPTAEDELPEL
jgi:hypothetical protein